MPYQEHSILVFRVFYIVAYCICKIKQIQSATIDDQDIFLSINTVSLATVDHVLRRNTNTIPTKPRASLQVKQLCYDYVQVIYISTTDCVLSALTHYCTVLQ